MRPLFEAVGGIVQPDEEKMIVPRGTRYLLLETSERTVQIAGKSVRVPYILFEEIEE